MPGQAERRSRLKRVASELADPPAVLEYFARPPRSTNAGGGWYMGPDYKSLVYIGYSAADAEVRLIEMVRAEEGAKA
jgi:hypothetical protein